MCYEFSVATHAVFTYWDAKTCRLNSVQNPSAVLYPGLNIRIRPVHFQLRKKTWVAADSYMVWKDDLRPATQKRSSFGCEQDTTDILF